MSVNLPTHFVQQYSTNIQLLLAAQGGKFTSKVMMGSHVGKQASPVDQFGAADMQLVTSRFAPKQRTDVATDRRWVFPSDYDLNQMVDSFDKLKMITDVNSTYVVNAVKAANRQMDRIIINAFTSTAKTGETGATSTIFTAANEVDVATGGANSKLNVAKLKAVRELMETQFVDFETEEVYCGLTAADNASLLNEIQIISSDFNGGDAVLKDGRVVSFLGFQFCQSQLIEQLLAGTNEVTLPVWCKSGMYIGLWEDVQNDVHQRHDIQGDPWEITTTMSAGATRLEENKVYAIESYRA